MEQLRIWATQLLSSLQQALQNLIAYLPAVLLAVALLIVGWVLARILRGFTLKAIERVEGLFAHVATRPSKDTSVVRQGAARSVATVVFWAVMLSFVAAALRSLGWPVVETWMEGLLAYLPELVGGIVIILLGFVGGTLVRHVLEPAAASLGIANSALFGRLSQGAIILTGFIIGTGHLGIDVSFLIQITTVLAGVALAGLALALALGTRDHLANIVGMRYVRKHYRIGDRVRVGAVEGQIVEMTDGCLFLETEEGDVSVPGSRFSQEPFVKLNDGVTQ